MYVTVIYRCKVNSLKQQRGTIIEEFVYEHTRFAEKKALKT